MQAKAPSRRKNVWRFEVKIQGIPVPFISTYFTGFPETAKKRRRELHRQARIIHPGKPLCSVMTSIGLRPDRSVYRAAHS